MPKQWRTYGMIASAAGFRRAGFAAVIEAYPKRR
jgi:hypothetical protein